MRNPHAQALPAPLRATHLKDAEREAEGQVVQREWRWLAHLGRVHNNLPIGCSGDFGAAECAQRRQRRQAACVGQVATMVEHVHIHSQVPHLCVGVGKRV